MAKTLNELTIELKDFILDTLNDPRSKVKVKRYEFNALDVSMDPDRESMPHIIVSMGISEATFSIETGKKITGGMGPVERYVLKWLEKGLTLQKLRETWMSTEKIQRAKDKKTQKPESKFR